MIHMKKSDKNYFAASNTGDGFVNYFDTVFGSDERVYILKGGPGTGKSHFLKAVAKHAENKGLICEKYYCSSDPDSLDGIRIPEMGVSFFDGTAPHAADPKMPGVRDEILNLGQFWDSEALREQKDDIRMLSEKKSDAYASALSMLSLSSECMRYRLTLIAPYISMEKMDKAAGRFLDKLKFEKGSACPRPMRTFGMKGERCFTTFLEAADTVFCLSPLYGVEYLYLQVLLRGAMAKGMGIYYAPNPLAPDLAEEVYFADAGILVSANPTHTGKVVGTRRFLDSAVFTQRGKLLRFLGKATDILTEAALEEFDKMRGYHFALEQIYTAAMDFERKEAFTCSFIDELFH